MTKNTYKQHKHKYHLANFSHGSMVDVGIDAVQFFPGNATWICQCGKVKVVELKGEVQND